MNSVADTNEQGAAKPLVFLHIPKTAGTSFRDQLERHYGRAAVFPGRRHIRRFGGTYPPFATFASSLTELDPSPSVLTGHYSYLEFAQLSANAPVVTFLREPVARSISFLQHVQRLHPEASGKSLEEIAGLADGRPNPAIADLQTRLLKSRRDPNTRLHAALDNLQRLAFIGLVEQYEASIQLFNNTFATNLDHRRALNKGAGSSNDVSWELRDFLALHNREDAALYSAARELFLRRITDLRATPNSERHKTGITRANTHSRGP